MRVLHICNAFFESELEGELPPSLEEAFQSNPIVLQLQFLPLLYKARGEKLGVTDLSSPDDDLCLLQGPFPEDSSICSWGHSQLIARWAKSQGLTYTMPPWEVVKMVNSKAYSFAKSPLPGGRLLYRWEPLPANTLLKSCFGTAGRGSILACHPEAERFCKRSWAKNLPIIAEPFVNRVCDFSSQWEIFPTGEIAFLAITFCTTSPRGAHISNIVGDLDMEEQYRPFIETHLAYVRPVLSEMQAMGYFGNVGFDAMVYGENLLQPIVEINARKTMGWATWKLQQRHYLGAPIEMGYIPSNRPSPLPQLIGNRKLKRQIEVKKRETL